MLLSLALLAGLVGSGCSSKASVPKVLPARTFHLAGFQPHGVVRPGKPIIVSFKIDQPLGGALVDYRRGAGPHTGVHLIVVRDDLSVIIHRHPKIAPDGSISQQLVLPAPGPYRVLVDAYPSLSGPQRNFQLFADLRAAGTYRPTPSPPFRSTIVTDGYRVVLRGASHLRAIRPVFVTATVTGPDGKPPHLRPWYGALAHAIFFRAHSLDYFHTHVCAPGATGCTSFFGGSSVTGSSSVPGILHVGVLVPLPGTWRLFLQFQVGTHVVTAPFTLAVR